MQDCINNDLLFNVARALEHTTVLFFSTLNFVKPSVQKKRKKEEKRKKVSYDWVTAMEFLNSQIKGNKKSTDEKLNVSDEEKLVDCVPPELAFWFETL